MGRKRGFLPTPLKYEFLLNLSFRVGSKSKIDRRLSQAKTRSGCGGHSGAVQRTEMGYVWGRNRWDILHLTILGGYRSISNFDRWRQNRQGCSLLGFILLKAGGRGEIYSDGFIPILIRWVVFWMLYGVF